MTAVFTLRLATAALAAMSFAAQAAPDTAKTNTLPPKPTVAASNEPSS